MLHLSGDLTVSWILCENPACIPQALRSIAVSTSTWANKIAAHRNCPSDLLEQYATAKSLTLRSIAALHPNCPQATLERLSHSRDKDILGSVARNPTCPPPATTHRLLMHPNRQVAAAAAANLNLPRAAWAMWQLAQPQP